MKNTISKLFGLSLILFAQVACIKPDPQQIIDECIQVSGGESYESSHVEFDFREAHYKVQKREGKFKMSRAFKSGNSEIVDVMTKETFARKIDRKRVELADSMIVKYRNSINSVFYFALLPSGLNDAAVQKKYLEKVSIDGVDYHKIEITFKQEGGGMDYQDVYVYWINTNTHFVDFLAYSYEVDGGGLRFRKAYNDRIIEGIRFVDYINYKAGPSIIAVYELDQLYEKGELEELSKIETKNVSVRLLPS